MVAGRRRSKSFMAAVVGGAIGTGALAMVADSGTAQSRTDADQGSTLDPAGPDPAPRASSDPAGASDPRGVSDPSSDPANLADPRGGSDPERRPSADPANLADPRGGNDPEPGARGNRPKRLGS